MKFLFPKKGFTLIEIIIVLAIVAILMGLASPVFRIFQKESDLNNSAEAIVNTLRLSQSKTLASEGAAQYGIYFSTSTSPHQYILFKGTDYASRDTAFDEVRQLPGNAEISSITFGGGYEIVFDRLNGNSLQEGNLVLRLASDQAKQKTIYIEKAGTVSFIFPSNPSDTSRLKDARHVHIDYSRNIATATEKIILISGSYTKEIIIADSLKSNQIYWEGDLDVGGQIQNLIIKTHELDNPGSQFSVRRDRRYNNQSLNISLSGDASGDFVQYTADGSSTTKSSIYAADPLWR